jgi:hypothetical protein
MTQAQLESKLSSAIEKITKKFVKSSVGHEYRPNKQRILADVEDEKTGDSYTEEAVLNAYNNGISDFKEELQVMLEEIYRELILESF